MKRMFLFTTALALGVTLASCSKNDDSYDPSNPSNPSGTGGKPQLHYKMTASNTSSGIGQKSTAAGTIQWTTAVATPTLVKFEAKQGTSEVEYKSSNTTQIDLLAAQPVSFGNFSLAAGTYNEVELKIQLNRSGSSPAMQLNGTFTSGATAIPVTFTVNELTELKTEQHNVTLTANTAFSSVTTLDLSSFTTGVTESLLLAASLTNGTVVISSTSNTNLYNIIVNNFKSETHHHSINHD